MNRVDYRIKYPLPDLVNKQWATEKVKWLVTLATHLESKVDEQPGFAVNRRTCDKSLPIPEYISDDYGIAYLPFTPTISEFQLYLRDGFVRPYVRWIANQDALETISRYIYGESNPQYKRKAQGWEHRYVEKEIA